MNHRIEMARKTAKLTIDEISEKMNVSVSTGRRYLENPEKMPVEALIKFAEATGVTASWLINGEAKEIPVGTRIAELIRKVEKEDKEIIEKVIEVTEGILLRDRARKAMA